ncbi:protein-glutamate methylesterase/protein-glutamine glutaminase [Aliikangiella sp. IMCC44653]
MAIKVLIVDDSQFFCRRVGSILNAVSDIKIVGVANNGREAIQKAEALQPDVITLDVEMPIMDGITALGEIVKVCKAKVLMLSSLTYENAKTTLDALDAGATDFLLKSYESLSSDNTNLVMQLQTKIRELGAAKRFVRTSPTIEKSQPSVQNKSALQPARKSPVGNAKPIVSKLSNQLKLVAIGASTGGPVALQKVLASLPANFPYPITVTQHMPGTFTGAFATRLNSLSKLNVVEAQDGMNLQRGYVYIAPGGKQMVFSGSANQPRIQVRPTDPRLQFSPSVDLTFGSAAKIFNGQVLAIILTGMGSDGTEGSRLIKQKGGTVWAQDEASCVVYGMPMSVKKAGLVDSQLAIDQFSAALIKQI